MPSVLVRMKSCAVLLKLTSSILVMSSSFLDETSLESLAAAEMKTIVSTVLRPTENVSD